MSNLVEGEAHTNEPSIHLQDLADFLKTVDENSLVAITDPRGKITFVNDLFCRVSKYSSKELRGQDHRILNSGCHPEVFWRDLWETILSGNVWKGEIKNRAKDGSFYWVDATIAPSFDPSGHLKFFHAIYTEVSPKKDAEEILRQSERLDSLRVMAGGIAHDFNNMLTSIMGSSGIISEFIPENSPAQPFLEIIQKTVERAAMLTNQLLAFTGKGSWLPIDLEINIFIRGLEVLITSSVPKTTKVEIHVAQEPLFVHVDPTQLHQVLMSLVNNAIEAIDEDKGGIISITLSEQVLDQSFVSGLLPQSQVNPGKYNVLEVRDSGCGMTKQILTKIFDPFFTTKFIGRGLGMSAVIGIIRAWDGGIGVESTPGCGSVFRVYLPSANPKEQDEPIEQPSSRQLFYETVLFVDDESMLRECAAEILAKAGFDVLLARDGDEAIEIFGDKSDKISIVIMDVSMPGLNGIEATKRIRVMNPNVKVILSSGFTDQILRNSLAKLKPTAFLHKPYKLNALREIVQKHLQ